jgi:hypothetical protein
MGSADDPMKYIDQLIAEQRYDEALEALAEMARLYPERGTEIFQKIQYVMKLRDEYNATAQELIAKIVNDPTDTEGTLALIEDLTSLDKDPNPSTTAFIRDTKLAALFTYNRAKMEEVLTAGRAMIDAGRWLDAVAVYASGYALYRPEFDERGYDPTLVAEVDDAMATVLDAIARFADALAALEQARDELVAAASTADGVAMRAAVAKVTGAVAAYSEIRWRAYVAGQRLVAAFELVKAADSSDSEANFVPFAYTFTLGRRTEPRFEGVIGTMDAAWSMLVGGSCDAFSLALADAWAAGDASFESRSWAQAAERFEAAALVADATMGILGLWAFYAEGDRAGAFTERERGTLASRAPQYAHAWYSMSLALHYAELARSAAAIEALAARCEAEATPAAAAVALRAEIRAARDRLSRQAARAASLSEARAAGSANGLLGDADAALESTYEARARATEAEGFEAEVAIVWRKADAELSTMEGSRDSERRALEAAKPLVDGIASEDPAYSSVPIKRPVEATAAIAPLSAAAAARAKRAAAIAAELDAEAGGIADDRRVREQSRRAKALAADAESAAAQCADYLARAAALKRQADSARLEGDQAMRDARAALSRADFDLARERLERARERYLASLSFAEDAAFRASSDAAVLALGADIVRLENEQVVKDTLRFVAAGKAAYYSGDLVAAERNFIAAQSRWAKTHSEPEPEVETWLKLITTALTFKTGKEVQASDPLYAEISARLSAAKEAFALGQRYLAQGRKVDAIEAFRVAEERLREILLVFPFHQEANVLLVRIDLVLDPAASREKLARMYAEAKAKVESGDAQEGYSELLTIQGIDPNYPGLKAQIEAAEIKLGLRLPPPDPAALRESDRLTASAQSIVDSNDAARFDVALAQVNEALRLNPNNAKAVALKARILGRQGAPEAIALPAAAEQLYAEAFQLYQDGQYPLAMQKLNQLFERYPQARRVQKCIELLKKIEAKL